MLYFNWFCLLKNGPQLLNLITGIGRFFNKEVNLFQNLADKICTSKYNINKKRFK